ncbi:hypothetical protein [Rhodoblastus sp.]|uniref:hypothetical protein n=1 Tax=Rhodoblastus sp. TaxID=1962975 RepID=UPI003F9E988D
MAEVAPTKHALVRMRQRGLRDGDLRLVLHCGSQVDEDAYLLTDQDADREIERLKQAIQRLDRLKGVKIGSCSPPFRQRE